MKNLILPLLVLSTSIKAGDVNIPNTFQPNTPASAAEVNENFEVLMATINANNDLIADLQNQISLLQNNTVLELDGVLKRETVDGFDTAVFEAVNLQIINGDGSTNGSSNGLGNIVIGYLEQGSPAPFFCATNNAFFDDETGCINDGGTWAQNVHTGSHNLVLGVEQSFTSFGAIIGGARSIVTNDYSSVIGGLGNSAIGRFSSVTGGELNLASANRSSVSGGIENQASGLTSSVSGGLRNLASGSSSSIAGGQENEASGSVSSVYGGNLNEASGFLSSITAGRFNLASGEGASITGGVTNQASGQLSSITGGSSNEATSTNSSVTGGRDNIASGNTSTVSGGDSRSATGSDDWVAGSLSEDN